MKYAALGIMLLLVCGTTSAQDDLKYTGCLTKGGSLVNVVIGDEPLKPCTGNQTEITWNAKGPKGEDGVDGKDGEDGTSGAAAPQYQYLGNTGEVSQGGSGVGYFNNLCADEFGDESARMCTSEEVMNTTPFPDAGDTWGRVRPVFKPISGDAGSSTDVRFFLDASGVSETSSTINCHGWSSLGSNEYGLVVQEGSGKFFLYPCDEERSVACCAPVEKDD